MITRERSVEGLADSEVCPACSKLSGFVSNAQAWHRKRCGLKDRENRMRIHIIGGPGTGKTTLARELGKYLGFEAYELDQIAYTGRDFAERPLPDRVADIYRIAHRPAWISEGLFVQWTKELMDRANIIVWLDNVGWERGVWRITRRFIKSALHEVKNRRGLERFTRFPDYARHIKQLVQVFFSSRAYYYDRYPPRSAGREESRLNTAEFLAAYQDKVIHCNSDQSVQAFIDYIRLCHDECG